MQAGHHTLQPAVDGRPFLSVDIPPWHEASTTEPLQLRVQGNATRTEVLVRPVPERTHRVCNLCSHTPSLHQFVASYHALLQLTMSVMQPSTNVDRCLRVRTHVIAALQSKAIAHTTAIAAIPATDWLCILFYCQF